MSNKTADARASREQAGVPFRKQRTSGVKAGPPGRECFARSAIAMPLVSIVVTNHNYSKYVESCLSSITCQTYGNIECIIVDDASRDGSDTIIQRFLESEGGTHQIQYVKNAKRVGQLNCFRIGVAKASGDFIAFVDSDDLLFNDFVETHVRHHLRAALIYGLSCSDIIQIGADCQVLAGTFPRSDLGVRHEATWDFDLSQTGRVVVQQNGSEAVYLNEPVGIGLGWPWSATSGMMFRRAIIDMIVPARAGDLSTCADAYLCYTAHTIGGSIIIRSAHGCYRRHGANNFSSNPIVGVRVPIHPGHITTPFSTIQEVALRHAKANRRQWTKMLGPELFEQILRDLAHGRAPSLDEPPPAHSPDPASALVDELERTIAHLKEVIRGMSESTSWKLTRPLRVVGDAVKATLRRVKRAGSTGIGLLH